MTILDKLFCGYMSKDERDVVDSSLYNPKLNIGLKVFDDHGGLQKGELHTIVGGKGIGKSTLNRSIMAPLLNSGAGILLLISEERRSKYLNSLNKNMLRVAKTESSTKELMKNLNVISELECGFDDFDKTISDIEYLVDNTRPDVFVFDNFTTSYLSEVSINKQSAALRKFKYIADKYDIPVILFFHTSKMSDSNSMNGDSVRGSATAINIGSYNYVMNQVLDCGIVRNFIYTEKARYHSDANKKFYEMTYNSSLGLFVDAKDYYIEDYKQMISGGKKRSKGF